MCNVWFSGQGLDPNATSVEADEEYDNISPKLLYGAFTKYNRSISQYYFDYLVTNKRENLITDEIPTTPKTEKTKSSDNQQVHETFPFKQADIDRNDNIVVLFEDDRTAPENVGFFQIVFDIVRWMMVSILDSEMYDEEDY